MLMRVGDEQRRKTIVTQNLGKPYIFLMFDEKKEPTIICTRSITAIMLENAQRHIDALKQQLHKRGEVTI